MRAEVVERIRQALVPHGLAAAVVCSPENLAYVNGFVVPSHPLMRWRHAMAVVTADGRTAAVCVDMEESTVRERLPVRTDLRVWREFGGDAMLVLAELVADLGLGREQIGIELDYLPASGHLRLREAMPAARLVGIDPLLARLRQTKDDRELALLRQLSKISEQAIADAFAAAAAGSTELDLASALTTSVYAQGADHFKLMIVATGERSQLPNVGPTSRVLQPGDVCRVEIFSMLDGYHAGVCRTGVVSGARPEAAKIWQTLVDCKRLLLDTIRPGVGSRKVWDAFKTEFDRLGLPAISFVGHGVGVHLHEEPYIGPHSDGVLEAGMVLGIEPLVYDTGMGFGLQLKDMIAVTADGCELLSDLYPTDELAVLG